MPRPPQLALLLASARGALEAGGTRQAPCSPTAPTALSLLAPTSEAYGSLLGRWLSSSSPGAEPPGERRGAAATQPRQPSHTAHAAGGRRGQVKQAAAAAAAVVGTTSAAAEDAGPAAAAAASPPGLLAVLGAMAGVARGLSGAGLGQATFGIQALARQHEAQLVVDDPPGEPLHPVGSKQLAAEAERLLDGMELAHGAYRRNSVGLAATTCLRAQHVRVWRPQGGRLQPGYFVAVDHPGRRVVWGVRGTRVFSDLLTDLAMAAHPLGPGSAHWGMTHAAHHMLQQDAARVGALLRSLRPSGPYRLQLVGHSLGGAVAALAAVMLREGLGGPARSCGIAPELVSCLAFAPPACMCPSLAAACRPYVTSVVLGNDVVPRFNALSLKLLQDELQEVDWFAELQRTLLEHSAVRQLSATLSLGSPTAAAPATTDTSIAPADGLKSAPAGALWPTGLPDPTDAVPPAAAAALRQLSAAVVGSEAFRSAVQSMDEWRAKTVAAAGGPVEVAARQADLIRAWLKELADSNLNGAGGGQSSPAPGGAKGAVPLEDTVKQVAEAAAEKLRDSVDKTMASLATAARESMGSVLPHLPSIPSLPQPHELPLVDAGSAVGTAAAAAASGVPGAAGAAPAVELVAAGKGGQEGRSRGAGSGDGTGGRGGAEAGVECGQREVVEAGELVGDGGGVPLARADSKAPVVQGLPLLLPPGRILHLRPHRKESSATRLGGNTSPAPYTLVELSPGQTFRRLVLGRSCLEDHQCRAYRRVLAALARH